MEPSIESVNTIPHGGQMESFRGKRRGLQLNAESSNPSVNTVQRDGQIKTLVRKEAGLRAHLRTLCSTIQPSSPRWSDGKLVSKEAGLTAQCGTHTPSIAFRHLPPNSAGVIYATEGALFISAQLSTDAVSALRKVRVLIWL